MAMYCCSLWQNGDDETEIKHSTHHLYLSPSSIWGLSAFFLLSWRRPVLLCWCGHLIRELIYPTIPKHLQKTDVRRTRKVMCLSTSSSSDYITRLLSFYFANNCWKKGFFVGTTTCLASREPIKPVFAHKQDSKIASTHIKTGRTRHLAVLKKA